MDFELCLKYVWVGRAHGRVSKVMDFDNYVCLWADAGMLVRM